MLHSVYLFKDVKITPDYSVVHDLTPDQWKTYLIGDANNPGHGDIVFQQSLNYYRLPDVIRIEANYDEIRKVTYGMIDGTRNTDPAELVIEESFERPMFFFVKDVRLIRQDSRTDKEEQSRPRTWEVKDVVELDIEVDVWSSNYGSFELYDSYVERRHMDRWKNIGTDAKPVWEPIYYPNASQGIEGSYVSEDSQDLSPPVTFEGDDETYDLRFILIFALKQSGQAAIYVGTDVRTSDGFVSVYKDYNAGYKYFGVQELLNGNLFKSSDLTSENVQSITVLPYLAGLKNCLVVRESNGTKYLTFDTDSPDFGSWIAFTGSDQSGNIKSAWLSLNFGAGGIYDVMRETSTQCTVIAPDHDAAPEDNEYLDEHEPMLYMSPARVRKAVTAFGGEVFTVPDIVAFEDTFTLQNIIDLNSAITYVFAGTRLKEANVVGALGAVEAATLPIWNSAWRSYEAINKVGDEISYTAKQMQTIGGGIAGAGLSAAGGYVMGGKPGGYIGLASGVVGTVLGAYGNKEELRAKQVTIKNSPCVVKSGGSGLGAYVRNLTDVFYNTLKLDDVSMEKLRFMYYWYGYHVNRTFMGSIDLHTRTKFDFIKTNGAKIRGALTAGAAQQIAGIFDNGVTIFHGMDGYDMIGSGTMLENDEYESE